MPKEHVSASSARDENEFSLVLRGPDHFVAPSLLLSRWIYNVAYLFDINMLPIWEVHMTEELVKGLFFCNNLVNYKYITCSLLCFLWTCWMCLIQIRQKYIRSSSVGKHNFGFILCFVYQLSTCFCFLFLEGRGYVNFIDDFWNSVVVMQCGLFFFLLN